MQEESRARDLFYALWIPDLFMRRVEANEEWSLMCPHECPDLHETWGKILWPSVVASVFFFFFPYLSETRDNFTREWLCMF